MSELTQVLHRFFHDLDERRYDAMLDRFTEDCLWLRQGKWLAGKAAVREALETRAADVDTRHVMSNTWVRSLGDDGAVLEAYMTAYRYPTTAAGETAPTISSPLRFNLTTTVFRRDAALGWRIAEQRMVTAFNFAG
ncbi:MAG: nuclear transport factor 2 family protein [Janthinobacterium lividum]